MLSYTQRILAVELLGLWSRRGGFEPPTICLQQIICGQFDAGFLAVQTWRAPKNPNGTPNIPDPDKVDSIRFGAVNSEQVNLASVILSSAIHAREIGARVPLNCTVANSSSFALDALKPIATIYD